MDPMRTPGPRLLAILAVLVSAAVGVVTNLITNRWNWTLAAVLAVLLAAAAVLAAQTAGARRGNRTRIRQKATGRSRIDHSEIKANDASITQTARRKGTIMARRSTHAAQTSPRPRPPPTSPNPPSRATASHLWQARCIVLGGPTVSRPGWRIPQTKTTAPYHPPGKGDRVLPSRPTHGA